MRTLAATAGQAAYHDFVTAAGTWEPAKRAHVCFVVHGALDPDRLERAVGRVVAAHETLRTSIETRDGAVVQVVRELSEITESVCETTEWDGTAHGVRRILSGMDGWWSGSRALPIEVVSGRSADGHTLVVCAFDHARVDGMSAHSVAEQIRDAYDDSPGRIAMQFADYYADVLDDGLQAALDDWTALLDRVRPALPPWAVHRGQAARRARFGVHRWSFDGTGTALVHEAARQHLCSAFEILAAAVGLYFRRPDGEPAAPGVVHSGRHRPGGPGVVGLVRGFVVHDVTVEAGATVAEAVAAQRDRLRSRLTHLARLPLEEVCARTGRAPGLRAGAPGPWEVELNGGFTRAVPGRMAGFPVREIDGGPAEEVWAENGGPALVVSFRIGRDEIVGGIRYAHPPVDRELAVRIARDIEATARFLGSGTGESVDRAPAFHRLVGWSAPLPVPGASPDAGAEIEPGPDQSRIELVHTMFREAAGRTPDAVAVLFGDRALTYGELDRRARLLTRRLRALGVGPEIPVGVRLGRSIDLVVAVLGVLGAGGVHLPVEPATPAHRCRTMLDRGAVRILVTRSDIHDPAVTGPVAHVVCTDEPGPGDSDPAADGDAGVRPDNLAYITFTSGSSGTPKAVGTTHRSATTYLRHLAQAGYLTAWDTALQLAAPSFDASVRDMLGPLTVGGRVVLVPDHLAADAGTLADLIVRHGVGVVPALAPATVRLLCDADRRAAGPMRLLMVSGEALSADTARRARDRFGQSVGLVNHYGPTECTMTSTFHRVDPGSDGPIPVGRPPSWGRVHVLDATLRPVPAGAAGELYIGGIGVARGYLGDPARSAARFLPDPFGTPGDRMYRTGDLGRRSHDGVLHFHGRADAQLNVNGVRVEPGEVEAALQTHRAVREAAVAAVPGSSGGSLLVGYVVPHPGHALDLAELRAFVGERLPETLVPKALLPVGALPRTRRGKVDRAALTAHRAAVDTSAARQPGTEDEALMLALWRDLLRRPDLTVHDNLLAAGGDSILVMALVSRIRRVFGRAPEPADIFRAPTVAAVTPMLSRSAERLSVAAPKAGRDIAGPVPLSSAQQRLWFFEQLLPGSPLNTVTSAFLVDGEIDRDAMAAATRDLTARHDVLRATFGDDDGRPVCRITDEPAVSFEVVSTPDLPGRMRALAGEPLDIRRGPLLTVTVFDGDAGRALLVRVHHLVADARSLEILLDDLAAAYRARRAGDVPRLPSATHSYADYTRWQDERLTDERAAREVEFWRAELAGAPPLLALPTDRARPAVQRHRGAAHQRAVPPELAAAATVLGRAEGASPFMALLTVWAALLGRYSGQDEVVIGVPVGGRAEPEFERIVGLFVNVLPVRVSLRGAPTFRELLRRVSAALFGAIAHGDLPFDRLVEHLRTERGLSHGPVFQSLADTQRTPSIDLPGVRLTPTVVDTGTCWFDLSVSFLRRDTGLVALYTFNTDLFDAATVEVLAAHFENLLAGALSAPDRAVAALGLDRSPRPSVRTRDGHVPMRHPLVPQRVSDTLRRTPERIAVTGGGQSVTYAMLDVASAGVAAQLGRAGLGAGALVGLCAERGPDLVAGLLGILRAGAAYLPLDPAHPVDRLAGLVADARPELVLAQPHLVERLGPAIPAVTALAPPESAAETAWASVRPEDLAYVIYTSGSTGAPKGVEVTHAGLAHVLGELARRIDAGPEDTLVAVTTVSFDIAALELLLPLLTGGRVVLADTADARDPARLAAVIRAERATLVQATPTTWQLLADRDPLRVRIALCGGEAMPPPLAPRLRAMADAAFNVYGPTETTIWSTMAELGEDEPVPIGDPIGDTVVHLLDAHLRPVPLGVAGEIYLGGPGVARGYRGRPELTAARFPPDPYADIAGARMYRTGDRGRRRRDGGLEYLGRVDRQVKLRGFRIEPAEVERALLAYPPVRQAVAAVRSDAGGRSQLVAYVVADARTDTDLLRRFVGERLPGYLVPAVVVRLDAFPLTANGKIDQAGLPPPSAERPRLATEYRGPASDAERILARIWSDVLGVDEPGVDDDFFDLGGHSLSAIQLMSRTNAEFGVRLELYTLFAERTVRRMARRVRPDPAADG